jgi:CheY-like chemotaxis protein
MPSLTGSGESTPVASSRILLVEDDAIIALSEERALAELGLSVAHARDAEEALLYAKENRDGIDVVLMDVDLGRGMDGIDAAFELRKDCDVPIVFLSSSPESEIVARTQRLSSWYYFPKDRGIKELGWNIMARAKLLEVENAKYDRLTADERKG